MKQSGESSRNTHTHYAARTTQYYSFRFTPNVIEAPSILYVPV
jgi:hypothetical protein